MSQPEGDECLSEYGPLSAVLKQLPKRTSRGLRFIDVEHTSLDITKEYIAVGTNIGVVFVWDRKHSFMQRLIVQDEKPDIISCIKMHNSIDYVVATATSSGILKIFVLPSLLPQRNKELYCLTISDMHTFPITTLVWSQNAQKLFSGDSDGKVNCTELDFDLRLSKSYEVLAESGEIVQLEYKKGQLLVSSNKRSILHFTSKSHCVQIGSKPRKIFGLFGATFVPGNQFILASRPGLRIWKADHHGAVQNTYIFKDILTDKTPKFLLTMDSLGWGKATEDHQFGPLLWLKQKYLVTWHKTELFLLDAENFQIKQYHRNVGRIVAVSVLDDEVFILRQGHQRSLIRLGFQAERISREEDGLVSGLQDVISEVKERLNFSDESRASPPPWGGAGSSKAAKDDPPSDESASVVRATQAYTKLDLENSYMNVDVRYSCNVQEKEIDHKKDKPNTSKTSDVVRQSPDTDVSAAANVVLDNSVKDQDVVNMKPPIEIDLTLDEPLVFASKVKKSKKNRSKSKQTWNDMTKLFSVVDGDTDSVISDTPSHGKHSDDVRDRTTPPRDNASDDVKGKSTPSRDNASDDVITEQPPDDLETLRHAAENPVIPGLQGSPQRFNPFDRQSPESQRKRMEQELFREVQQNTNIQLVDSSLENERPLEGQDAAILDNAETAEDGERENEFNTSSVSLKDEILQAEQNNKEQNSEQPPVNGVDISGPAASIGDPQEEKTIEQSVERTNDANDATSLQEVAQTFELQETASNPPSEPAKPDDVTFQLPQLRTAPLARQASEDFYSMYHTYGSLSPPDRSIEDVVDEEEALAESAKPAVTSSEEESSLAELLEVSDNWVEFSTPSTPQTVAATASHLWLVDHYNYVHVSPLGGIALRWKLVDQLQAARIKASPSGKVVWRLQHGTLSAALGVTSRQPVGNKWSEFANNVVDFDVDNSSGCYVSENGGVFLQKELTVERPCYRSERIFNQPETTLIAMSAGVIWLATKSGDVIVSAATRNESERNWFPLSSWKAAPIESISLKGLPTVWLLTASKELWFFADVTPQTPQGSGQFWEVNWGFGSPDGTTSTWRSMMTYAAKGFVTSSGNICDSSSGLWMQSGTDKRHIVHRCIGNMIGHRWEPGVPPTMASSICWDVVCATGLNSQTSGLVWAVQAVSRALVCWSPLAEHGHVTEVSVPNANAPVLSISVRHNVAWLLQKDGSLWFRDGMNSHFPAGKTWDKLDLAQLGKSRLVDLAVGTDSVWGVDDSGQVYLRIGIRAPTGSSLAPVWVPVGGSTNSLGAIFTRVFVGGSDWLVWALDSGGSAYARRGITEDMPIGSHWASVNGPGLAATSASMTSLALSRGVVYGVTQSGGVLVRRGVTREETGGTFWQVIPGRAVLVTVSADDSLYCLTLDGRLLRREYKFLKRTDNKISRDLKRAESEPLGDEWELI